MSSEAKAVWLGSAQLYHSEQNPNDHCQKKTRGQAIKFEACNQKGLLSLRFGLEGLGPKLAWQHAQL